MNLDFEDIKALAYNFINQNKNILILSSFILAVFAISLAFVFKNNYENKLRSSNMLIDYIYEKNDDFLKNNHKNGYKLIKEVVVSSKNPSVEIYDKFAKMDDYVFKNLFYFSKVLYCNSKDMFHSYYETSKNPWSNLIIKCGVFYGEKDASLISNKGEYLSAFLIGKGVKC